MFRRRSPRGRPTDSELVEWMGLTAEAFRQSYNAAGFTFHYGQNDAAELDAFVDEWLGIRPTRKDKDLMARSLGAYLGELLVRHGAVAGCGWMVRASKCAMGSSLIPPARCGAA
ncbi:hypothetical protein V6K52_17450 [Knoellia sp. S7-12]|uniref:hypothetical protein n=1 Tax=Knoellia sp. S7-12 TaxID=3126698 RepID=UPI00336879F3